MKRKKAKYKSADGEMGNFSPKKAETSKKQLLRELKEYEKNGCRLYLNGSPSGKERIAEACLKESSGYMRDFVGDELDRIQKVDFIRVK